MHDHEKDLEEELSLTCEFCSRYGRVEYERIAAKESYLRTVNTLELSEKRNFRSRKLSFLTELNLELEKHFPEKKCCMGSTEMRNINNG